MNDAIPQFMPPHTGEIPNHGQDRYAAHAPPTYSPPEFGFEEEKPPGYSFEDKFVVKQPTYNDVWAAVLVWRVLTLIYSRSSGADIL